MISRFVLPTSVVAVLLVAACQTVPNDTSSVDREMPPEKAMFKKALLMQSAPTGVPDLTGAKDLMEKAAEAGSADAMDRLGDMYRTGDGGVSRDIKLALEWYKREGELSEKRPGVGSWGLVKTGLAHETGTIGLDKSSLEADGWFQKAAATAQIGATANDPSAMTALSYLLAYGKGIKEDDVQAWHWAIKAIEFDEGPARTLIAEFYAKGQGVPANEDLSFKNTLRAAQLGVVDQMVQTSLGFMNGDGAPVDHQAGVEWIQKAIERGSSRAMRELGNIYYKGQGVQRNDQTARTWYQKAIEQNDAAALGFMGQLVQPRDRTEASSWYTKGAEARDPGSMYWLAMVYLDPTGTNLPRDPDRAIQLLQAAAEADYGLAMTRMGQMYEEGIGVQASSGRALGWYRRAAAVEDQEGMYRLASVIAGALATATSVPPQYPEAKTWLLKSANSGFGPAMTLLGQIHSRGVGRERFDRDPVLAAKWFEKGAKAGERVAMREYGELLVEGKYASRDFRAAADWFNRASQLGDTIALIDLGLMFEKGLGTEVDYNRAMQAYQEADLRGDPAAKAAIGHMYQDGLGVERNPTKAIALFLEGAAANDLMSIEMLAQTYEFGKGVLIDNVKTREYYRKAEALGSEVAQQWLQWHPEAPTTATRPGIQPLLQPGMPAPAPPRR